MAHRQLGRGKHTAAPPARQEAGPAARRTDPGAGAPPTTIAPPGAARGRNAAVVALAFVAPLLVYLRTLAPTVQAGDAGELITAARPAGRAAPHRLSALHAGAARLAVAAHRVGGLSQQPLFGGVHGRGLRRAGRGLYAGGRLAWGGAAGRAHGRVHQPGVDPGHQRRRASAQCAADHVHHGALHPLAARPQPARPGGAGGDVRPGAHQPPDIGVLHRAVSGDGAAAASAHVGAAGRQGGGRLRAAAAALRLSSPARGGGPGGQLERPAHPGQLSAAGVGGGVCRLPGAAERDLPHGVPRAGPGARAGDAAHRPGGGAGGGGVGSAGANAQATLDQLDGGRAAGFAR